MRGSVARRRISVPMCDNSTAGDPNWHIRPRWSTINRVHRVTPDIVQRTQYCPRSTMFNVTVKHTQVKKPAPLTSRSSRNVDSVSIYLSSHCRAVLQNRQDKTPKASPKNQSTIQYSPGLPQDTNPLRSCSGNRATILLKSYLGIICHF